MEVKEEEEEEKMIKMISNSIPEVRVTRRIREKLIKEEIERVCNEEVDGKM